MLLGHSKTFLESHTMKQFKRTLWILTAVGLLSIVPEQLWHAPDWTGGATVLELLLVFMGWFVYAIIIHFEEERLRTKLRQETETWFCTDCHTVSGMQDARKSGWGYVWLLLLLWPIWFCFKRKRTCPACKGHNLVSGDSPRARHAVAGQ
jgi:hypothetical protein